MYLLPHLRQVLAYRREASGVSKKAIARAIGIHVTNVSRFERGDAGWPLDPDAYVRAYAEATGCEPVELWAAAVERMATPQRIQELMASLNASLESVRARTETPDPHARVEALKDAVAAGPDRSAPQRKRYARDAPARKK